ncbi:MAG TPA: hypothetical protein VF179_13110 [Thermoanaerobaculia bacterium]|nr:hypothetical protein [Thermoanaerobaculia bacterium]
MTSRPTLAGSLAVCVDAHEADQDRSDFGNHFRIGPYPGSSKSTPPSGSYGMWSYQSFGNSTAYRQNMEASLDWCPGTWCF